MCAASAKRETRETRETNRMIDEQRKRNTAEMTPQRQQQPRRSITLAPGVAQLAAETNEEELARSLAGMEHFRVRVKKHKQLDIYVVGCGGTASWLAPALARLVAERQKANPTTPLRLIFVDDDLVEKQNVARQNFSYGDVGAPKARVLAARYAGAYGLSIGAWTRTFNAAVAQEYSNRVGVWTRWNEEDSPLIIVLGCVDNAAARREISAFITHCNQRYYQNRGVYPRPHEATTAMGVNEPVLPLAWWIDAGNTGHAAESNKPVCGQILVGSAPDSTQLEWAFVPYLQAREAARHQRFRDNDRTQRMTKPLRAAAVAQVPRQVIWLPSPGMQDPTLLEDQFEETEEGKAQLSCEELAARNQQALLVNQVIAAHQAQAFADLLGGTLERYATLINVSHATVKSDLITQGNLERFLTTQENAQS